MNENTFYTFDISKPILRSLDTLGFDTPTPVQRESIGPMMEGKDLVVQAPTGTGKTCAFGIPLIEAIEEKATAIQALILCPTRELALQITDVLHELTMYKQGIRIAALYGGEPIERQISQLKRKPQIVVATPGRMIDHIRRKTARLSEIHTVVLDEADRMLDMGFRDELDTVLSAVPEERQTVLFSATISNEIRTIAYRYQKDAQEIHIHQETMTVDTVKQYYTGISAKAKGPTLVGLLRDEKFKLSLVFVGRKSMADEVARMLKRNGFNAAALHGDMHQKKRNSVMRQYKNGELDVLVATDVAARGIDVDDIDAVINYDLPQDSESYVHRIGRTGRAESRGVAYTFITANEHGQLNKIMKDTKADIPFITLRPASTFVTRETSPIAESNDRNDRNDRRGNNRSRGGGDRQRRSSAQGQGQDAFARVLRADKLEHKPGEKDGDALQKVSDAGQDAGRKQQNRRRRNRRRRPSGTQTSGSTNKSSEAAIV